MVVQEVSGEYSMVVQEVSVEYSMVVQEVSGMVGSIPWW